MEFSYRLRSVAADDITFSGPGLGGNAPCFIADYSPFGVQLDCLSRIFIGRRTITSDKYRYGFQGQEKDDEVKSEGNSYDFGARMYDSRLGRWLAIDALTREYPAQSPYSSALNSPIQFKDLDGNVVVDSEGRKVRVKVRKNEDGTYSAEYTYRKSKEKVTDKLFLENGGRVIDAMIKVPKGRQLIRKVNRRLKKVHYNVNDKKSKTILVEDKKGKKRRFLEMGLTRKPFDKKYANWEIDVNIDSSREENRLYDEEGAKPGEKIKTKEGIQVELQEIEERRDRTDDEALRNTGIHETKHFLNWNIRGERPSERVERKGKKQFEKSKK